MASGCQNLVRLCWARGFRVSPRLQSMGDVIMSCSTEEVSVSTSLKYLLTGFSSLRVGKWTEAPGSLLAVFQRQLSVLCLVNLTNMAASSYHGSQEYNRGRKSARQKLQSFSNLIPEGISYHFFCIYLLEANHLVQSHVPDEGIKPRYEPCRQGSVGARSEAAYYKLSV